jgi:hypothetical protein
MAGPPDMLVRCAHLVWCATHETVQGSEYLYSATEQMGGSNNTLDFCLAVVPFESQLVHGIFWLRILIIFLSRSRQILWQYLQLGHEHFQSHCF